jgi:hypothetical protein
LLSSRPESLSDETPLPLSSRQESLIGETPLPLGEGLALRLRGPPSMMSVELRNGQTPVAKGGRAVDGVTGTAQQSGVCQCDARRRRRERGERCPPPPEREGKGARRRARRRHRERGERCPPPPERERGKVPAAAGERDGKGARRRRRERGKCKRGQTLKPLVTDTGAHPMRNATFALWSSAVPTPPRSSILHTAKFLWCALCTIPG